MSLHNWSNKKIINENTSNYMQDMQEIDYDIVEEARGKKIADPLRAKLMGMEDIRGLKGTMTPRYFATKVIRFLQSENPDLDIKDLSDDEIQNAINVVANVSKPLSTRSDVKITTRERGSADAGLKKGDSGFETLQLNLGSDAVLSSQGEVGENDLYTIVKDGLKYRVTLNNFKGTKVSLDDVDQDDLVSVVIVKPSEMETVDKFGGEIEMGQREKLVADFPEGEEDDMSNVINAVRYMSHGDQFGMPSENEIDYKKADLDNDDKEEDAENCSMSDEETSEYEKAREGEVDKIMKKEQERAGQAHARAVADHYEDENDHQKEIEDERKAQDKEKQQEIEAEIRASRGEQDDNDQYAPDEAPGDDQMGEMEHYFPMSEEEKRCPVTGKLRKKKSESEEEEQVAMSQLDINNYLANQYRQKMQNAHSQERMYRHGY
jgi:hypothetical protein